MNITHTAGQVCTLNGQPAKVTGRLNAFATIATLNVDGPSFEFAWSTVERIMARGGAFKS